MQDDFSGRLEEEEFEESVQDLLHHLIVLLLGTKEVLKHLYQVRGGDVLGDLIVTANGGDKHHAFQDYVVLGIAVDEVVVQILY